MNSPLNNAKVGASTSGLRVCARPMEDRAWMDARCEHGRVGKRVAWAAYSTLDPQDRRISPR
jgi:hypothetical protein